MPKFVFLPDEIKNEILKHRENGLSYRKIRELMPHISMYKIQQTIKYPNQSYEIPHKDEVMELRGKGLSYRKIKKEIPKLSIYMIQKIIKQNEDNFVLDDSSYDSDWDVD